MPLDPQVEFVLARMAAAELPPMHTLTVAEAREGMILASAMREKPEKLMQTKDREIPGPQGTIPIRIYTPEGPGPFPLLVYFHGGGWVIGNLDTHDNICHSLSGIAECVTVAVDYRLAPEHKYPAAPEDCYAATKWAVEHADELHTRPELLAVGGDSAGGNLATVVTMLARERGGPKILYQLLLYPVTDYNFDTPSYLENAEGLYLTRDSMIWFWNQYVSSEEEGRQLYASPIQAEDLHNLPPAMIITAEYDPLRDEGEAYAQRLKAADVSVEAIRYPGVIHGFMSMADLIDQGKHALTTAGTALRTAFHKGY
jgi:acetyl esterase